MARIVIRKGYDCNRCSRKGCSGDVLRDRKGNIRKHLVCPGQIHMTPMKSTLLERASENTGSMMALGKVLEIMGLRFDQTMTYPYFRFLLNNEQEVISNV